MILLIDNYDSFSYNLYQLIGSIDPEIRVVRNDKITIDEIRTLKPKALILSPGPGRPKDAAICEVFGCTVGYAKELMHGKSSQVRKSPDSLLFKGLPERFQAARYHSLSASADTLPPELKVTAITDDGEVMAVEHSLYPVYGVQFHPESVMTPDGKLILKNFLEAADAFTQPQRK